MKRTLTGLRWRFRMSGYLIMNKMKNKHVGIALLIVLSFITGSMAQSGSEEIEYGKIKYELVNEWPQLSEGYILGQPTGIGIDNTGHIFVFHRAGRRWTTPFPDS